MYILENNYLEVKIHPKGAELQRLYNKQTNIEHLWSGDQNYWGKYSPILFPIVGTLKENTYYHNDKSYNLSRHGFARDKEFTVKEKTETTISFSLQEDIDTLKVYPFPFLLTIQYTLENNKLICSYLVENTGNEKLFFSIGAHPAFTVPFLPDTSYDDYYLEFEKDEQLTRWKLTDAGLVGNTTEAIILQEKRLPLTHKLFESDAIVMKNLQSNKMTLSSDKSKHGISFSFSNAPYFGIWAAPQAPFVCLEPWAGIADASSHNQALDKKEGINVLMPSEKFISHWEVLCF